MRGRAARWRGNSPIRAGRCSCVQRPIGHVALAHIGNAPHITMHITLSHPTRRCSRHAAFVALTSRAALLIRPSVGATVLPRCPSSSYGPPFVSVHAPPSSDPFHSLTPAWCCAAAPAAPVSESGRSSPTAALVPSLPRPPKSSTVNRRPSTVASWLSGGLRAIAYCQPAPAGVQFWMSVASLGRPNRHSSIVNRRVMAYCPPAGVHFWMTMTRNSLSNAIITSCRFARIRRYLSSFCRVWGRRAR